MAPRNKPETASQETRPAPEFIPPQQPAQLPARINDSGPRPGRDYSLTLMSPDNPNLPPIVASFDLTTEAGFKREIMAQSQTDRRILELEGEPVWICDWLVTHAHYVDDEGELRPGLRVVMFLHDGRTVSSASPAVARLIDSLARRFGGRTINPPFGVRFVPVNTGNGTRQTWKVIPVDGPPPDPASR